MNSECSTDERKPSASPRAGLRDKQGSAKPFTVLYGARDAARGARGGAGGREEPQLAGGARRFHARKRGAALLVCAGKRFRLIVVLALPERVRPLSASVQEPRTLDASGRGTADRAGAGAGEPRGLERCN